MIISPSSLIRFGQIRSNLYGGAGGISKHLLSTIEGIVNVIPCEKAHAQFTTLFFTKLFLFWLLINLAKMSSKNILIEVICV